MKRLHRGSSLHSHLSFSSHRIGIRLASAQVPQKCYLIGSFVGTLAEPALHMPPGAAISIGQLGEAAFITKLERRRSS